MKVKILGILETETECGCSDKKRVTLDTDRGVMQIDTGIEQDVVGTHLKLMNKIILYADGTEERKEMLCGDNKCGEVLKDKVN